MMKMENIVYIEITLLYIKFPVKEKSYFGKIPFQNNNTKKSIVYKQHALQHALQNVKSPSASRRLEMPRCLSAVSNALFRLVR